MSSSELKQKNWLEKWRRAEKNHQRQFTPI